MAHNDKFSKLKKVYLTRDIIPKKVIMEWYHKEGFLYIEFATEQNFQTTLNLAKELILNIDGYNFVEFDPF